MSTKIILLAHGSGGRLTHTLIRNTLLKKLNNPILAKLGDGAVINYKEKIVFTTDSFVVSPLFFPGGDIGKLAVSGTINDLVMMGSAPEYLSLALIMEEGFDQAILEKIIESIALSAKLAGVKIITGDTKVVEKGAVDRIFINTSGIGRLVLKKELSISNITVGDKIILTGNIAEHGLSVLAKRRELDLGFNIKSDCQPLNDLILPLLKHEGAIKFMRDPTRGGVATTLNEIAASAGLGIIIEEKFIPISQKVRVACELLGIDPLYVANEGSALLVVSPKKAYSMVKMLRKQPKGLHAGVIGEVINQPKGRLVLRTIFNTQRILDMLTSEPLPRIC
ncbi:MAG: hydrogenase expression/formation protein HypE [Candidatus Omnitrophica bacterium]|nr:hydrogenase expression/formation protein HypE [Candidatus Omnitrophota bacterium]